MDEQEGWDGELIFRVKGKSEMNITIEWKNGPSKYAVMLELGLLKNLQEFVEQTSGQLVV